MVCWEMILRQHYIDRTIQIAKDQGHVQPWPELGLTEEKEVYVLPPTFSRNSLYWMISKIAPDSLKLSERCYEDLFNDSEDLRIILIGKTAKGVCAKCMDRTGSIAALKTVVAQGGEAAT